MDSPPQSPQESPFHIFVSNLSPIRSGKASHVAQGFFGPNSPLLVFKSPRIICHRETQHFERAPCTQSPSGEISQSDNGGKSHIEAPGDSKKSNSQSPLPVKITTDTEDFEINDDTQNCSPTPSVDEYLADPAHIDLMYLDNSDEKQSNDAVESSTSDLTQSKKIILEFDSKDGPGDKAEEPRLLSKESNKVHQAKAANVDESGKIEGEKKDVEWDFQERTKLESNLSADIFERQHSHDSLAQCAGNELRDHNDGTPQSMPDLQEVKECEDCDEMTSTSHVGAENISQDGSEASLKHHGVRRRCLQFEEAASNALGSNKSHMKLNSTASKIKMVKLFKPITSLFPCSKPSGIGLHLNSIINAMPPDRAATTDMRLSDALQGTKSASSIRLHKVDKMKRCLISSNMDGQSSVDNGNEIHEIDVSIAADSFISGSSSLTEPVASCPASVHDKRKLSPTDAGNFEGFNQPSPSKKKKRTSINTGENGCKGCKCKKSKCLKLYCECFAAEVFCTGTCSCEGCSNTQEFGDKVYAKRRQIESRNQLAFLPKIVQHTSDIPSNNMEDVNLKTPSSARHKRGCNCKRSMCQKKYCECYQANVGCSDGCRCEGCKNSFGRKEDNVAKEHASSQERVSSRVKKESDGTYHKKLEMLESQRDLSLTDLKDLPRLPPLTPSLQCSDQGKDAAKSRFLSEKYLPSPESVNMFTSHAKYTMYLGNSHSSLANLERNEMLGTASYDWQMDYSNVAIMDQSSPCNSVVKAIQLNPPSNSESMPCTPSFPSNTKEWTNIQQSRLSDGFNISGSALSRNSPITPRSGFGEYLQSLESESGLFDIQEDGTPDILKEASTPIKSVKANSPTQKRVSLPHGHLRGLGSSSSGGMRIGMKFILKSLSSFPPLTPCMDSKGNVNEDFGGNI